MPRPWTRMTLEATDGRPGVRAGGLAADVDLEKAHFKMSVRKLKGLGLTESLVRLDSRLEVPFRILLDPFAPARGRV